MSFQDETDFGNTTQLTSTISMDLVSERGCYIFIQVSIVIRTALCWTGIFTNVLSIRAFLRMGLKDSLTIVFFGLAVSDFFHLCTAFVYAMITLVEIVLKAFKVKVLLSLDIITFFAALVVRIFTEITYFTTTFLAIQRCLCVALPLHFKGIFTVKRVVVVLVTIWLFVATLLVTMMTLYRVLPIPIPGLNASVYVVTLDPLPGIVVNFLYTLIGIVFNSTNVLSILISVIVLTRALTKSVRFRQKTSTSGAIRDDSEKKKKKHNRAPGADKKNKEPSGGTAHAQANTKEKQAIIQVTLVSCIFLCCNIPRMMGTFAAVVEPRLEIFGEFHYLFLVLYITLNTMDICNSSVNFFVYYKYNSKFRSVCFQKKNVGH